jgi:endonuclease YncB( thermonuclease family)
MDGRLAVLVAVLVPVAALAGPATVIDGDTLEVDEWRYDLWGIEVPEFGQLCRRGRVESDCGVLARAALMDLTAGADVRCAPVADTPGKAVCRADGYDLSEGMVYTGWGFADLAETDRYLALQDESQAAGRGLWSGFEFVMPAAWQAGERLAPAAAK